MSNVVREARRDGWLRELAVKGSDGESTLPAVPLCLLLGGEPLTQAARECLGTDHHGYVLTEPGLRRGHRLTDWPLERRADALATSRPGVAAAGDVRDGLVERVASASGDGARALSVVHRSLARGEAPSP